MPSVDVTVFNVLAEEPDGDDAIVQIAGAQALGGSSSVSAQQQSNPISVSISGASAQALSGETGLTWATNFPAFLPIIPGGAGFGMDQFGGSGRHSLVGGRARTSVVFVDNINEGAGTGTLESAIKKAGPRTVVPQIGGLVDNGFQNQMNVRSTNGGDYLTFAGQCAPDNGLFTRGSGLGIYVNHVHIAHLGHFSDQQPGQPSKMEK